ncbi:MAG TPA: hypothetical protein VES02_02385 [Dermatophilaceae bacterium]|nr:hypothetical protein [Dermatophilaceae bacterium]
MSEAHHSIEVTGPAGAIILDPTADLVGPFRIDTDLAKGVTVHSTGGTLVRADGTAVTTPQHGDELWVKVVQGTDSGQVQVIAEGTGSMILGRVFAPVDPENPTQTLITASTDTVTLTDTATVDWSRTPTVEPTPEVTPTPTPEVTPTPVPVAPATTVVTPTPTPAPVVPTTPVVTPTPTPVTPTPSRPRASSVRSRRPPRPATRSSQPRRMRDWPAPVASWLPPSWAPDCSPVVPR